MSGADPGFFGGGMASAGARAYMGVWGRSPQWGPGATPLVRGLGGEAPLKLTTYSHLKENLNNENCTLFSIIYAVNNVTICAETLPIYKLDDNDKPVICQLFC